MNKDILNKTTVTCIQELGEKGAEFTIVAGKIIKATSHLKHREEK